MDIINYLLPKIEHFRMLGFCNNPAGDITSWT